MRGIYCVAFGRPARACAVRLLRSVRRYMPGVPVMLCAASTIGLEDQLVVQPDSDIGGRRAKLRAYELTPPEWDTVLYLDADTELTASVDPLFRWVEDGWDLVICRDVKETLHSFARKHGLEEFRLVERAVGTLEALQFNGGVWAFRRSAAVASFFARWLAEWEVYGQRDQGALIRALYAEPIRVFALGNEWNRFPKFTPGVRCAGINHYPMEARRWTGAIPGRIDSAAAWAAVQRFEGAHR